MKLLVLAVLIFYSTMLIGQNFTEIWFSNTDTTSSVALDIVYNQQAEKFFILSNIQEFQNTGSSIPINGWYTLGSTVTALDENLEILWDSIYQTNCSDECSSGAELYGRVPSNKFLFNSEGNLFLPYEDYGGLRACNESFNISFFERTLEISTVNGEVLNDNNRFYENLSCMNENIHSATLDENGIFKILTENLLNSDVYIRTYDETLTPLDSTNYQNNVRPNYLSQLNDKVYDLRRDKLIVVDIENDFVDSVDLISAVDLYGGAIRLYESSEYICIIEHGRDIDNNEQSIIWMLNHDLDLISTRTINLKTYNKALLIDNKLLALDQKRVDYHFPTETGFTVDIYDLNLDMAVPSQSFGDSYTRISHLKELQDNNTIAFVGGRLKSFDVVIEQAPDQSYLLLLDESYLLTTNNTVKDEFSDFGVKIYPNPTESGVKIEFLENETVEFIDIVDATGKVINTIDLVVCPGDSLHISLDNIPPGLYFLRFKTAFEILTRRVIKI